MARAWQLTITWTCLCWSSWRQLAPVAGQEQQNSKLSVAVVGAGIGGSSASFFLRELVGEDVDIVVFDEADKPGGRTDVRAVLPLARVCVVSNWATSRGVCGFDIADAPIPDMSVLSGVRGISENDT